MKAVDLETTTYFGQRLPRFNAAMVAVAAAVFMASSAVTAQGLPGADDLGSEEPADEQIQPSADEAPPSQQPPAEPSDTTEAADTNEAAEQPSDATAQAADQSDDSSGEADDESSDTTTTTTTTTVSKPGDAPQEGGAAQDDVDTHYISGGVNLEGARGFQHIASADAGQPNTYRVAFIGAFTSGSDVIRYRDENDYVAGRLLFEATILEQLSANIGIGATNNVNTFGRPEAMLAQGDLHVGVRGHYEPTPGFYVAGDVTTYFPSGFSSAGLDASGTSVRPRFLATADFADLAGGAEGTDIPLKAHFNVGYRVDNTANLIPDGIRPTRVERFAYGISGYDYLQFGLGVEYALPYVSPFVSWKLDVPVNADDGVCAEAAPIGCVSEKGFGAFPDVLSVGAQFEPVKHFGLTAGVDIGLSGEDAAGVPVTAPWQIVLGASWAIDPTPEVKYVEKIIEKKNVVEKRPPQGFLVATVTDKKTGKPVEGAVVHYRKPTTKTPQSTSPQGMFQSYGFEPGQKVVVEITHPDYKPAKAQKMLQAEGEAELAVALEPLQKQGVAGGVVIDQNGDPIPDATVKLTGPDTVDLSTGATGKFKQKVPVGSYTIAASADGYLTGGRDARVASDKRLQLEITLQPEPKKDLVEVQKDRIRIKKKVFFETGKAAILPRSFDVLNQVASVLLETPRIRQLRIDGHTDDVGASDYNQELSRKRADSVVKYLVEQGISQDRLDAKGFGETQPLVPNVSKRNRSLNRRVEFRIVEQGLDEPDNLDDVTDGVDEADGGLEDAH